METILFLMLLTKIDGAKYNTRDLQRANFTNIQVKGNSLYGTPIVKTPLIPKATPNFPKENFNTPYTPTTFTQAQTPGITNEPYYNKALTGTGIQLQGKPTPEQQKIAQKYSSVFRMPIAIKVVPNKESLSYIDINKDNRGGQNIYNSDKDRPMEIRSDIDYFEYAMLHEIGHNIFHYDEKSAEEYANRMMELYK